MGVLPPLARKQPVFRLQSQQVRSANKAITEAIVTLRSASLHHQQSRGYLPAELYLVGSDVQRLTPTLDAVAGAGADLNYVSNLPAIAPTIRAPVLHSGAKGNQNSR